MPQLTLTRINSTFVECNYVSDNGEPLDVYEFKPLNRKDQHRVSKTTGLSIAELLKILSRIKQSTPRGEAKPTVSLQVAGPATGTCTDTFAIRLRGLNQPAYAATVIECDTPDEALYTILDNRTLTVAQPVFEWSGTDRLACLDVDYHYDDPRMIPSATWRTYNAGSTKPTAIADHLSHAGGVKLYYVECDGFRADELAAVAAVHWLSIDGRCKPEIKSQSRHPFYVRPDTGKCASDTYNKSKANTDVGELAKWFGRSCSPEQIEEWLHERGMRIGDRLEHNQCPIYPGYVSKGTPVFIGDYGIHCHSCEASGRSLGGRRPGFVSYARLLGTVVPAVLQVVKRFCHWEHARIVMSDKLKIDESILRRAYSALLKMFHSPADPRIPMVFKSGTDMVRQLRRWTSVDGAITYHDVSPMFAALPATHIATTDGEGEISTKPSAELVSRFGTGSILSEFGYPPVTPLAGAKIYGHNLEYSDDRIFYAVPHRSFMIKEGRYRPVYLKPSQRYPESKQHPDPWRVVEQYFPGVNREYVKLLLVQKGMIEGSSTQAPFILVSGPTKAGKSTTIHLAASIAGDYCTDIVWTPDTTRLRQAIYEGVDAGTFVAVNEIFKESKANRVTPVAALDPILNLTENSTSHVMYVGPQSLDKLPALVCTDIEVPRAVQQDKQLSRRFVYVRLSRTCDWEKAIMSTGLGQPRLFRCFSDETAQASNTILSEVIDEFFSVPVLWVDAARQLGFSLLDKSDAYDDPDEQLRLFFSLVDEAPTLGEKEAKRYPGPGWKMIRQDDTGQLAEVWGELAGNEWSDSRRCGEVDWSKLMGTNRLIEFDATTYKSGVVFVRFRVGGRKSPDFVNSACLDG